MIRHYLLTIYRLLKKSISTSIISMLGLIIGISCILLIVTITQYEKSYDAYHTNADRLYRVETTKVQHNSTYPGTPTGMVSVLRSDVKGIERVAPVRQYIDQLITVPVNKQNSPRFKETVYFADSNLFELFDFTWMKGDIHHRLSKPNEAIITESFAKKYFNLTALDEVVGKTLVLEMMQPLLITGIIADPPGNSDFDFNIIVSYTTLESVDPYFDAHQFRGWSDRHQTFVLLNHKVLPQDISQQFPAIIDTYMGSDAWKERQYTLLPLSNVHFRYNFSGRTGNLQLLQILSIVSIFILLISGTNFINLATVRAFHRAKEVGLRKVFGSGRRQLMGLFLLETGITTLCCLLIAIVLTYQINPFIIQMFDLGMACEWLLEMLLNPQAILFLLGLWIAVSLIAGIYPAYLITLLPAIESVRNKGKYPIHRFSVRNILIVSQFVIATTLVIGTIVISKQLRFVTHYNLGFDKDNIITVALPNEQSSKFSVFRQRLLSSPYIQQVSYSNNSPSSERNVMSSLKYIADNTDQAINTQMKYVDEYFLKMFDLKVIAGMTLAEKDTNTYLLINEEMVKHMGLTSPSEAIGEKLIRGKEVLIIKGVVKNFHVNSLHQSIDPTALLVRPQFYNQANIKIIKGNASNEVVQNTLQHIKNTWLTSFPNFIFDYNFLEQKLDSVYREETLTARFASIATFIALVTSCLGLFSLAMSVSASRSKEMAIRKILGASSFRIMSLYVREYLLIGLLSVFISIPLAWWAMDLWLENFAFRIELGIGIFVIASMSILIVILVTTSYQAVMASFVNPVIALKND